MGPKKNKNKENPFYYYMCDKRPEVERKLGRRVPMSELPSHLHREWKELSEEKKTKYKALCSDYKGNCEKYDSRGIPLSKLQREIEEKENKEQSMREDIKNTVLMLCNNDNICKEKFYILSVNYYLHLENDTYIPAELGVCKFSIEKGVLDKFHCIFEPRIPPGDRYNAVLHSESSHHLLEANSGFNPNYMKELKEFLLADGGKYPVLYVHKELLESVQSMMANFHIVDGLKIYSLDHLLMHIYSCCLTPIPETIASDSLNNSRYDYNMSIICEWHKDVMPDAGKFCALSIALRGAYNLIHCLSVQKTFGIKPLVMRHFPQLSEVQSVIEDFSSLNVEEKVITSKPEKKPQRDNTPTVNRWGPAKHGSPLPQNFDNPDDQDAWPSLGFGASVRQNAGSSFVQTSGMAGVNSPPTSGNLTGLGRGRGRGKWAGK